jgi:hypothetical protein
MGNPPKTRRHPMTKILTEALRAKLIGNGRAQRAAIRNVTVATRRSGSIHTRS